MNEEQKDILKTILKIALVTILAMMAVGLLTGCRSKKEIVDTLQTGSTQTTKQENNITSQKNESLDIVHYGSKTTSTDTEVQIVYFDTQLPPDSATGQRPVKAIATIKQRSNGTETNKDTVQAENCAVFNDSTKVEEYKADSLERATESKKTSGSDRFIWTELLCGVFCLLALVAGLCYLLVKAR